MRVTKIKIQERLDYFIKRCTELEEKLESGRMLLEFRDMQVMFYKNSSLNNAAVPFVISAEKCLDAISHVVVSQNEIIKMKLYSVSKV